MDSMPATTSHFSTSLSLSWWSASFSPSGAKFEGGSVEKPPGLHHHHLGPWLGLGLGLPTSRLHTILPPLMEHLSSGICFHLLLHVHCLCCLVPLFKRSAQTGSWWTSQGKS